jgi:flavin-dependent dehydrogenase
MPENVPWVVIVGGGFAGLAAARALKMAAARIILIDRTLLRRARSFWASLADARSARLAYLRGSGGAPDQKGIMRSCLSP